MKWKPPSQPIANLALPQVEYESHSYNSFNGDDSKLNPRKEALLNQSLDLVRDEPQNERAVSDIFKKALDAGLYPLAIDAVQTFSPDANHSLCWAIARIFDPKYWKNLPEGFEEYCAKRLIQAHECRAGMYMGDHCPDNRSSALGYVGLYYLSRGNQQKAFHLWQIADDPYDVDEAIAKMSASMAGIGPQHLDSAMALIDLINTKTIKAKAMSEISDYY